MSAASLSMPERHRLWTMKRLRLIIRESAADPDMGPGERPGTFGQFISHAATEGLTC